MQPVAVKRGLGPVILGQPHGGTFVPSDIWDRLNHNGRKLADTDWHIARLYEGLSDEATVVAATFHRYVIDANRDPSGATLYPGQNTTELCPTTDFDGLPIYAEGKEPEPEDIAIRLHHFHAPYHAALQNEIDRVKAQHGFAILYDCHSIRSHIPHLFAGTLPQINIGTNNSTSCAMPVEAETLAHASGSEFSCVLNGRFRGGWTTRHYGQPNKGIHAIQMEIAQSCYLEAEAPPFAYSEAESARLRPLLRNIIKTLEAFKP